MKALTKMMKRKLPSLDANKVKTRHTTNQDTFSIYDIIEIFRHCESQNGDHNDIKEPAFSFINKYTDV